MSSFNPWQGTGETEREFIPLDSSGLGTEGIPEAGALEGVLAPAAGKKPGGGERSAAAEEAFSRGIEEGRRRAREETGALARQLEASLVELGSFTASVEKRYTKELIDIAVAVAERILRAELKQEASQWLSLIQEGIRQAVDCETVRIRVAQPLYGFLVSELPRLRELVEEAKTVELVEDAAAGECGCIIETRYGEVDVGLRTQLSAARAALLPSNEGT